MIYYDDRSLDHEPETEEVHYTTGSVSILSFKRGAKETPAPGSEHGEIVEDLNFRGNAIAVPSFNILDIPVLGLGPTFEHLQREQKDRLVREEKSRRIQQLIAEWLPRAHEWANANRYGLTEEDIVAIDKAIAGEPERLAKQLEVKYPSLRTSLRHGLTSYLNVTGTAQE
jgi:hypothetical protein